MIVNYYHRNFTPSRTVAAIFSVALAVKYFSYDLLQYFLPFIHRNPVLPVTTKSCAV